MWNWMAIGLNVLGLFVIAGFFSYSRAIKLQVLDLQTKLDDTEVDQMLVIEQMKIEYDACLIQANKVAYEASKLLVDRDSARKRHENARLDSIRRGKIIGLLHVNVEAAHAANIVLKKENDTLRRQLPCVTD